MMKLWLICLLSLTENTIFAHCQSTWGDWGNRDDWGGWNDWGSGQSSSISTDSTYYYYSYDIVVTFDNPSARSLDWVGIFDSSADLSVEEPLLWLYTCGSQTCSGTGGAQASEVTLGYGDPIEDSGASGFPLPPGDYVAALMRNEEQPYDVVVSSDVFYIRPPNQGRPPATPPSPTPEPPTSTLSTSVSTSRGSYRIGETIEVIFSNARPRAQDWVAIYDSNVDLENLSGGLLWLYACGSQYCRDRSRQGTLEFGYTPPDESWQGTSFPLQRGYYVVVLARSLESGGSQTLAHSSTFRVR